MDKWLWLQLEHFNILMLVVILFFTSMLSKMNLTKEIKEQNRDLRNEFEEIKDEIRGHKKDELSTIYFNHRKWNCPDC